MPNTFRKTGLLFAAVFLAGYLLNIVNSISESRDLVSNLLSFNQIILLLAIAMFLASAFVVKLRYLQPIVFLTIGVIPILQEPGAISGLTFFMMGMVLLERAGFFLKFRVLKIIISILFLMTVELIAVFTSGDLIRRAIEPTFMIMAFGLFLWFLYKERLVIIMREPRPRVSLTEKGLSPAERLFVMKTLSGKSQKEIAFDYELSESTIRNTLARAYKKLDVEDKTALAILGERSEVVE